MTRAAIAARAGTGLLLLLVVGCGAPTNAPAVAGAGALTISGSGSINTEPFHLAGSYTVAWTAAVHTGSSGCFQGAFLERLDGSTIFEPMPIGDAKTGTPATGSTILYNLDAADYYLKATSGCDWSYTFTPR